MQENAHIMGHFDFRSYKITMAMAIVLYVENISLLMYYLLPVDENDQKYFPVISEWLTTLMDRCNDSCCSDSSSSSSSSSREQWNGCVRRVRSCCASLANFIEMLLDVLLLLGLLAATILCKSLSNTIIIIIAMLN